MSFLVSIFKTILPVLVIICSLWQCRLSSFQGRDTKSDMFLAKNQHNPQKSLLWYSFFYHCSNTKWKLETCLHNSFGRSVKPIPTRGVDYTSHLCVSTSFWDIAPALVIQHNAESFQKYKNMIFNDHFYAKN